MHLLKTREVLKNIAKDHGVSTEEAQKAISSVFEYVRKCITEEVIREENYFPTIRIPNWGLFYVKEGTKKGYAKQNNKDESI